MLVGALLTVLAAGVLLPATPVAAAAPDLWAGALGDGGNTSNNPGS
ncbi:hypothetical protein JKP76_00020 [Blastococcus sp. TML/C7B]|nr:hypothetical protein [Blastococcus sp. TML/C7B]MBN1094584.1 hypothetical protein [Blastococcus sp. TML/C7B]